jgi:hypothetical protein
MAAKTCPALRRLHAQQPHKAGTEALEEVQLEEGPKRLLELLLEVAHVVGHAHHRTATDRTKGQVKRSLRPVASQPAGRVAAPYIAELKRAS